MKRPTNTNTFGEGNKIKLGRIEYRILELFLFEDYIELPKEYTDLVKLQVIDPSITIVDFLVYRYMVDSECWTDPLRMVPSDRDLEIRDKVQRAYDKC